MRGLLSLRAVNSLKNVFGANQPASLTLRSAAVLNVSFRTAVTLTGRFVRILGLLLRGHGDRRQRRRQRRLLASARAARAERRTGRRQQTTHESFASASANSPIYSDSIGVEGAGHMTTRSQPLEFDAGIRALDRGDGVRPWIANDLAATSRAEPRRRIDHRQLMTIRWSLSSDDRERPTTNDQRPTTNDHDGRNGRGRIVTDCQRRPGCSRQWPAGGPPRALVRSEPRRRLRLASRSKATRFSCRVRKTTRASCTS